VPGAVAQAREAGIAVAMIPGDHAATGLAIARQAGIDVDFVAFDQLEHYYQLPGEYTHRLTGDKYGFETLSFIVTETHPGGGPGLHVHDTEEAHILLEGTAEYRIGTRQSRSVLPT
jgi:magnesium-transporting ATPase (P-type)